MQITDAQIIKALRLGLKQLTTELAETPSAHLLGLLDIAAGELAARHAERPMQLREAIREVRLLTQRGHALDAFRGHTVSPAKQAETELDDVPAERLHAQYAAQSSELAQCMTALGAALPEAAVDGNWQSEVRRLMHDVASHDVAFAMAHAIDPPIAQDTASEEPLVARLTRYFAQCRGTDELRGPFTVEEATLLSGGFSRKTVRVTLTDHAGTRHRVVVRLEVPGGFLEGACNSLAEEVPFHRLASANALPVPVLHWHECDHSHLGADFLVMSFEPGSLVGFSYTLADSIDEGFFRQLAEILATMHRIDWHPWERELRTSSRIPPDAPIDAMSATKAMFTQFESYWLAAELEPPPMLAITLGWLARNMPRTTRPAVLCHADIGFHNLLVTDGRISALLDWETSRLGDPAREIGYIRPMVSHYMDWERFLGWYEAAGGIAIDRQSLDWHEVFSRSVSLIVIEVAAGNRFPHAARPDLEHLRLDRPVRRYIVDELRRAGSIIWGNGT